MLKVGFVIRNDGLTKGGGDIDQAKQFGRLITRPGELETAVVRYADLNVADFDLIVFFNIDMPFESYLVAKECVQRNIPYVIYTLHPKIEFVEEFLRYGTHGAQQLAARAVGYSLGNYETVAAIARLLRNRRWKPLTAYRSSGYSARYVLRNAERVLVSCEDEADQVRRDFPAEARFDVLRHLVDEKGLAPSGDMAPRKRESFVLCAARIEPRKNQMSVVEAAKACPEIEFLFVGEKNFNHGQYIAEFEAAIATHGNMRWRDRVPLAELQRLITEARAYINLSWFEVFSLIDMMAMTSQTPSIISAGSYLYNQIHRAGVAGVEFVDPRDSVAAAEKLRKLPAWADIPRNVVMDESWTEAAIRRKWSEIIDMAGKERARAA